MKPALIIMAAGIGRRFGGTKQITPVGPAGEFIIEYSAYDAMRAGFGKIIFVITKEIETRFKTAVGDRVAAAFPVEYAYQSLGDVPRGFAPPAGRTRPWGTGHAVYCCRELIDCPFAVINADDFYGADAFNKICAYLSEMREQNGIYDCCMVGYRIENTMSEHGYVSRAVCGVSEGGSLIGIDERTRIEYRGGRIAYAGGGGAYIEIAPGTIVSLNMWGFPGGAVRVFESSFRRFLERENADYLEDEFFLPAVVGELLASKNADVKVLTTASKWYGVTYRDDLENVKKAVSTMAAAGDYPLKIWP
jgi:NDP-sugar pyrophosphorylase family protein